MEQIKMEALIQLSIFDFDFDNSNKNNNNKFFRSEEIEKRYKNLFDRTLFKLPKRF